MIVAVPFLPLSHRTFLLHAKFQLYQIAKSGEPHTKVKNVNPLTIRPKLYHSAKSYSQTLLQTFWGKGAVLC